MLTPDEIKATINMLDRVQTRGINEANSLVYIVNKLQAMLNQPPVPQQGYTGPGPNAPAAAAAIAAAKQAETDNGTDGPVQA